MSDADSAASRSLDDRIVALVPFLLTLAVPALFAYSMTPSATLLNQLLSVGGWGLCLAFCGPRGMVPVGQRLALASPLLALAGMAAGVLASWGFGALPTSLAVPPLGLLLMAGLVLVHGARQSAGDLPWGTHEGIQGVPAATTGFSPFALALVLTGVLSSLVAMMQVFWPAATDGFLIAHSGLVGRAVGNLRQPNHLSSMLVWGLVALVPLAEWRTLPRAVLALAGALMILGVLLSASRTGMVGLGLLAVWGLIDYRLSRPVRLAVVLVPVVAGLMWWGLDLWAASQHAVFGAEVRLGEKDVSGSRYGIWSNTLALIKANPITGVGWGEFNFAWTMSPFPGRPTAFFDHTHNLMLQLLVELGVPGGLLVIGLLLLGLVQALLRAWKSPGPAGVGARAAWMIIALIGLHSLLEYPLWYSYFLLPAAWAWGFALGAPQPQPVAAATYPSAKVLRLLGDPVWLRVAGVLMLLSAVWATQDYRRTSSIYAPATDDVALDARIARSMHSPLFAYHAAYAEATTTDKPERKLAALRVATHALIDGRLMVAWAEAWAESGDLERARYVAARLREFDKEDSKEFFAPCNDAAVTLKPWQCSAPTQALTWRDLR